MPNRLALETSLYLRQHRDNPVDWYPWGEEALERARKEDRPIFLSIGYAACHWCHVMERESFEDPEIARMLNEHFVAIKVDREERPDLDQIYMTAVQMMTGRGGWPMSVFLTPDLKPFYGGTYWPPRSRYGLPGFQQVLHAVAQTWQTRRDQAEQMASEVAGGIARAEGEEDEPDTEFAATGQVVLDAAEAIAMMADRRQGGFGGAPKFPQPQALRLLLRASVRHGTDTGTWPAIVRETLDAMYRGGIYDHLGGGFARYSVDAQWLVPHFEKMLYDNAQLATAYIEAFQWFGDPWMERVAAETLDYVLREMRHEAGGFFSSQDADSEGVEGKFYVWTWEEFEDVLGEDAAWFAEIFGVTKSGNWEGKNVLHLPRSLESLPEREGTPFEAWWERFEGGRRRLFDARAERTAPATDDKILTAWNGLMIDALARGGAVLQKPRYVAAAEAAADFLWNELRASDGRLRHVWCDGKSKVPAFLDDYAALALGLLQLYQATFRVEWLTRAVRIAEDMERLFFDRDRRRLDYTGRDQPTVIARLASIADSGTPGAVGLAVDVWSRLASVGRTDFDRLARESLRAVGPLLARAPLAVASSLVAIDWLAGPVTCDVLPHRAEDPVVAELAGVWQRGFHPRGWLIAHDPRAASEELPASLRSILREKSAQDDVTLYRCVGTTCGAPIVGIPAIRSALASS